MPHNAADREEVALEGSPGGGVGSPSTATVIDNRDGAATFTDGPCVESKEHVVGLWIIEVADLDVALELAAPDPTT